MIRGVFKADALVLAKVVIDWTKNPMSIAPMVGYVVSATGATTAWSRTQGVQWSKETSELLGQLRDSMERDLAAAHLDGGGAGTTAIQPQRRNAPTGLGEALERQAAATEPGSI